MHHSQLEIYSKHCFTNTHDDTLWGGGHKIKDNPFLVFFSFPKTVVQLVTLKVYV